ncbi:MAG: hypothetical protein K1X71_13150 [Pirellulales bacterium]|nr:hypothetical protein [Pirellulales bacterium]
MCTQLASACARNGMRCAVTLSMVLAALASSTTVLAGVIPIAPPPSVLPGVLESNTDAYRFDEQQVLLGVAVAVDIATPGLYDNSNPDDPGVIPAGTWVRSYFLHRDPVGSAFGVVTGTVISPTKVLGIIFSDANLDATDPLVGALGTTYPTGTGFRGMEIPFIITPDEIFWDGNQVTVSFESDAALVVDQIRVLAEIPEPASATITLSGCFALGWAARRRARRLAA